MNEYVIRALDASTWDAFARLAEKHNGMGFGGCWCTWFHSRAGRPEGEKGRPWKERLVREGNAHAALIFDGDAAVAWAQYGTPDELPNIHHRKEYEATRTEESPDYRITCIFVDRDYRRTGVAGAALRGALELIANAGGGVVEGYPQDLPQGKPAQRQEPLRDAHSRLTCLVGLASGFASDFVARGHSRTLGTRATSLSKARFSSALESVALA